MHVRLRPALLAAVLSSCAAPEAKHPNPTHPIAEGRAIAIIARAFQDNGTPAAEGRDIRLANGTSIHMDVAAAGQTFGVAYLTRLDLSLVDPKADLPAHPSGTDFWITQGAGPDAAMVVLLLDETDYQYDDLVGTQHEATSIAAENRLLRDVRDFLVAVARHVK
jgi:hypothetical protein